MYGQFSKFIKKINYFDLLGWRQLYETCVLSLPLVEVLLTSDENCQSFSQILMGWSLNAFGSVQRISFQERVEMVDFVIFSQMVENF